MILPDLNDVTTPKEEIQRVIYAIEQNIDQGVMPTFEQLVWYYDAYNYIKYLEDMDDYKQNKVIGGID